MIISSTRTDGMNREFHKLIRRERMLWLVGVVLPILLVIAVFVF